MRDIKNKLTSGKNTKNIKNRRGKSFGYQVLGFGAGGAGPPAFITATGGTITTVDTDYKVHTFTGPGTFCVSAGAGDLAVADYLVIAGGGGGGNSHGAGGGAGGYRESHVDATSGPYTASPLAATSSLPISVQGYTITVGAGGAAQSAGSVSTFSTITSAGGGAGATEAQPSNAGGSGGGATYGSEPGGVGNTPPVSPPQGQSGGSGTPSGTPYHAGGGGGAGTTGSDHDVSNGKGGDGVATSINNSSVTRAGGGGAGGTSYGQPAAGAGGPGGGGAGGTSTPSPGTAGTANTGGGAGGAFSAPPGTGGAGGSGIVIIRYKFQQDIIMAHFAKISETNEVLTVLTLNNSDMLNADGVENESVGQQYLETHNNWPAQMWIQTSYNTSQNKHNSGDNSKALRGNYAGIGYTWDEDDQIFWPKKPYASWVKHNASASWKSPIGDAPALTEEQTSQNEANTHMWGYAWNEANTTWDLTDSKA